MGPARAAPAPFSPPPPLRRCPEPRPGVLRACEEVRTPYPRQWVWGRGGNAAACVPRELRHGNVKKLFRGKRIALAGDSHLRKMWAYMWTFLEGESVG